MRIMLLFTGRHLNLLRIFNLYYTSSFSVCLVCSFSRQPVLQAAVMEHLRTTLYKSAARLRSSKWLFTRRYLFMKHDGNLAFLWFPPNIISKALLTQGSWLNCKGLLLAPSSPCPSLWRAALPSCTSTGPPLLDVSFSLDRTSPACCTSSSWDSLLKCVLHHNPLLLKNKTKQINKLLWIRDLDPALSYPNSMLYWLQYEINFLFPSE